MTSGIKNFFSFFFGRMRLKKHSEKTDDARPKREQDQRKKRRGQAYYPEDAAKGREPAGNREKNSQTLDLI